MSTLQNGAAGNSSAALSYPQSRLFSLAAPSMRYCPQLSAEIGERESIFFLQIEYLIATRGESIGHNRVFRTTLRELHTLFPAWTFGTFCRLIKRMEEDRQLIGTRTKRGRNGFLSIWINTATASRLHSIQLSPTTPHEVSGTFTNEHALNVPPVENQSPEQPSAKCTTGDTSGDSEREEMYHSTPEMYHSSPQMYHQEAEMYHKCTTSGTFPYKVPAHGDSYSPQEYSKSGAEYARTREASSSSKPAMPGTSPPPHTPPRSKKSLSKKTASPPTVSPPAPPGPRPALPDCDEVSAIFEVWKINPAHGLRPRDYDEIIELIPWMHDNGIDAAALACFRNERWDKDTPPFLSQVRHQWPRLMKNYLSPAQRERQEQQAQAARERQARKAAAQAQETAARQASEQHEAKMLDALYQALLPEEQAALDEAVMRRLLPAADFLSALCGRRGGQFKPPDSVVQAERRQMLKEGWHPPSSSPKPLGESTPANSEKNPANSGEVLENTRLLSPTNSEKTPAQLSASQIPSRGLLPPMPSGPDNGADYLAAMREKARRGDLPPDIAAALLSSSQVQGAPL